MTDERPVRIIARNRKARHDFDIRSSIEAGIELKGSEVKSLRQGKVQLADAYAVVENGQVILKNLHITPYEMASDEQPDPTRPRRLLLHKREIRKLSVQTEQKGLSLVLLTVYFKGKVAKVELALGLGRRKYDKRQAIAKAESDRRIKRAMGRDH